MITIEPTNILSEAHDIIYGDREQTYGSPAKNITKIAQLWSAYLGIDLAPNEVCCMMILLKLARLQTSPNHRDSQVDICGYAALMERIQST